MSEGKASKMSCYRRPLISTSQGFSQERGSETSRIANCPDSNVKLTTEWGQSMML